MTGKEKRKWARVPYVIDVQLKITGKKLYYSVTQNISMKGVFLKTEEVLPKGTSGEIIINLEFGQTKIQVKADFTVVRSETDGMGLNFTSIDPDSSITLYNIIKYQS